MNLRRDDGAHVSVCSRVVQCDVYMCYVYLLAILVASCRGRVDTVTELPRGRLGDARHVVSFTYMYCTNTVHTGH